MLSVHAGRHSWTSLGLECRPPSQHPPCRLARKSIGPKTHRASATGFGKAIWEATSERPPLPPSPDLKGLRPESRWNATALAFLGDSVWELYLRSHFFYPPTRLTKYYQNVQERVCAESQAVMYELLQSGQFLTSAEKEVLRWGHNAKVVVPKRFHASGKHIDIYKQATAVECLVGYLYLSESDRLHQLMHYLLSTMGAMKAENTTATQ